MPVGSWARCCMDWTCNQVPTLPVQFLDLKYTLAFSAYFSLKMHAQC